MTEREAGWILLTHRGRQFIYIYIYIISLSCSSIEYIEMMEFKNHRTRDYSSIRDKTFTSSMGPTMLLNSVGSYVKDVSIFLIHNEYKYIKTDKLFFISKVLN